MAKVLLFVKKIPKSGTTLPGILKNYVPEDIYNVDETGIFWKCMRDKTMAFKDEQCHGEKRPKDGMTVLVGTDMTGSEKFPLLVIGKSKQPPCLKNIRSLPCEYEGQASAWITTEIYTEFVRKFDRHVQAQKRKVALVVDNCRAHPVIPGLKAVTVYFLPPNTTSKTQLMDQGIIQALKVYNWKAVVKEHIFAMDNKTKYKPMVLDALRLP